MMVRPLVQIRRSTRLRKMPPPVVISTEPEARQHSSKILPPEVEVTKPELRCSSKILPSEVEQTEPKKHSSKISPPEIKVTKPELRCSSKTPPPEIKVTKPELRCSSKIPPVIKATKPELRCSSKIPPVIKATKPELRCSSKIPPVIKVIKPEVRCSSKIPPAIKVTKTEFRCSSKMPPVIKATKPELRCSSKIPPPEIKATKPELRCSSKILPPKIKATSKILPCEIEAIKPEFRKHSNKYANLASHLKNPRLKTTKCSSSKLRRRSNSSKSGKLTKYGNKGTLCKADKPNHIRKAECVQRTTESSEDVQMSEVFLTESLNKPQTRKDGCNTVKDVQASPAKKVNYSNPTPAIVNRPKRIRKARRDRCCCQTDVHEAFETTSKHVVHDKPMQRKVHNLRDGAIKLAKNFISKKVCEDKFAQTNVIQSDCSIGETTKQHIQQNGNGLQVINEINEETSKPQMSDIAQVARSQTIVRNGHGVSESKASSSTKDSPERKMTPRTPTSRHNKYQRFTCMETGVSMQVNCHAILQAFREPKSKKYSKYRRSNKAATNTAAWKVAESSAKFTNTQSPKSIHQNAPCQTSQSTGIEKSTNNPYETAKTEESPTHSSSRTSSKTLPFFEEYTELHHSRDLEDQLTCHLCGLLFTGRCAIERHMVIHCNSKMPICFCALCNKTFVEFEHLEAHVLTCRRYQRLGMEEESRRGPDLDENMNVLNEIGGFPDYNGDFINDGVSTNDNRLSLDEEYPMEVVDNNDNGPTEMVLLSGNNENTHNIDYDEEIDPVPDTCVDSAYVCEVCGLKFTGIFSLTDHYWVHEPKMVPFEDAGTVSPELVAESEDTIWENFCWDTERSLVYRKDEQSISKKCGEKFAAFADNNDTSIDLSVAEPDENGQLYSNINCNTSECEQKVLFDLSNCVRRSDDHEHSVQTPSACAYLPVVSSTGHEEQSINISNMGTIANSQIHDNKQTVLFDLSNSSRQLCDPLPSTFGDLHPYVTQSSSSAEGDAETVYNHSIEMSESLYECQQCQEKFQSESILQDHMKLMGHLGVVQYVIVCSLEELQGFEPYEALQLNVGAVEVCLEDNANQSYVIQEYANNSLSLVQENILTNYRDVDILCQQCGQSFKNNMVLSHAPCFSTSEEQKYPIQELFESKTQTPSPVDTRGLYHCSKCSTSFPTKQALVKHDKRHIIGKECHICGKLVRMDFMDHVKSHNVELQQRLIVCEICEEMFPSMQTLAFHQSTKHNFITESALGLTYRCPHCKEELNNTPSFIAHVAAHTGVYPFECSICKRGYLYKAALNFHVICYHSQYQGINMPQTQNESLAGQWENGHERNDWRVDGPHGLEQHDYCGKLMNNQGRELVNNQIRELVNNQGRELVNNQGRELVNNQIRELVNNQSRELVNNQGRELVNNQSREHKLTGESPDMYKQHQLSGYYPSAHYQPSAYQQESPAEWYWRKPDEGKMWESNRESEHVPVIHASQSRSICEERFVNQEGSKSMPSDPSMRNERFEQYGDYTFRIGDQEWNRSYHWRDLEEEGKYQPIQNQGIEFGANLTLPKDMMGTCSTYTQQMRGQEERWQGYWQQEAVAKHQRRCAERPASTDCLQTLCQKDGRRDDFSAIGQETVGGHQNLVQKELNIQLNRSATNMEPFVGREQMLFDGDGHSDDKFRCAGREKKPTSNPDSVVDHQDKPVSSGLPHFGEAFSNLRIAK